MTDIDSAVERKRLVAQLRAAIPYQGRSAIPFLCHQAADEIDRLSSELTRLRAIEAASWSYVLSSNPDHRGKFVKALEALALKPAGGAE